MKIKEFIEPDRSQLISVIRDSMEQWVEEGGDLTELARSLRSTVGQTLEHVGTAWQISEEDIQQAIDEWKASRKLCTSGKPDSALGSSALASCKSQGYRSRDGKKSHKIGKHRTIVGGKKIKGKKYGGPLPDWGSR